MHKAIGVACLVVGILLLVWGYNAHQSFGSQLQETFTGSPSDKSMYMLISGAVLSIIGLFELFRPAKRI
jgi:hypothetical protein